MGFGLFSDTFPFYRLFQEQWAVLNRGTILLAALLKDLQDLPGRCSAIHELEKEQIRLFREIFKELSLTFIQPLERGDVHELNRSFDEAMRAIKAVSTRLGLYGFGRPRAAASEIAANLVEINAETGSMLEHLRTATIASLPIGKMDDIREETRMLFLVGVGELYEGKAENATDLLEIIKWTQIYDRLEEAFDRMVETSRALAAVILKNF